MVDKGILDGIKVLTLEQVHALPWGTGFLADLGAQVIRIESVHHLQDRKAGPFPGGKAGSEWWNEGGNLVYYGTRNKQSLCLDVTQPSGKEIFLELVKSADIVTDNFRPGTMERFGFDHESLSAINPNIITLSSTAYGYTGPWRRAGSRARTVDAACGLSYLTGYEGGPSYRASNNYMDHSVGNNVAFALLLALYERKKTGVGMRIDLTMQETGISSVGPAILEAQRGIERRRLGCGHLWKSPHNVYPCKGEDRWIVIVVSTDSEWESLIECMGNPGWAIIEQFDSVVARWKNRNELDTYLSQWTQEWDPIELMEFLQGHGVSSGAVLTAEDLVDDPHLNDRNFFQRYDNLHCPDVGARVYAGRPFKMTGVSMDIKGSASLGEHNEILLHDLGDRYRNELPQLYDSGIISNRPQDDETRP